MSSDRRASEAMAAFMSSRLLAREIDLVSVAAYMLHMIRCLLVFAVATLPASGQSTWTVDRLMRPGYHFPDLPAAVAAASPGDILFLRATTSRPDDADTYTGAGIQGKGLTIIGEVGVGLPPVRIVGGWNITGIPAGQVMLLRDLELDGSVPGARRLSFGISCAQCLGPVILEHVTVLPHQQNAFVEVITGNRFIDCRMIVLRNCSIDRGDIRWIFLRSRVMMSATTFVQSHPMASALNGALSDTMILDASELYASSSTIQGSIGVPGFPSVAWAIGLYSNASVVASSGTSLVGGVNSFGRTHWTYDYGLVQVPPRTSTLRYDPSVQLIGGQGQAGMIEIQELQTGLQTLESPGQITVVQHTPPLAPTFLLMGSLQTTPWTQIIGPVYIDVTNVWSDLQIAPASGVLSRTFPIPPTIPFGQWAGIQAFALESTGRLMTSNVSTVGVW